MRYGELERSARAERLDEGSGPEELTRGRPVKPHERARFAGASELEPRVRRPLTRLESVRPSRSSFAARRREPATDQAGSAHQALGGGHRHGRSLCARQPPGYPAVCDTWVTRRS